MHGQNRKSFEWGKGAFKKGMAKLYFRYGAMDSSKSANLIMVAYNYEKQGKTVVVLKPSLDSRSDMGFVESRIGVKAKCVDVRPDSKILELLRDDMAQSVIDCILVDECQFLNTPQVEELVKIVDDFHIPVICYGLKNSYIKGELFEGSRALLYYAESIEEIKTVCSFCNKKAIMNLRVVKGKPVYSGDKVQMGDTAPGEEYYIPVCRKHYFNPKLY